MSSSKLVLAKVADQDTDDWRRHWEALPLWPSCRDGHHQRDIQHDFKAPIDPGSVLSDIAVIKSVFNGARPLGHFEDMRLIDKIKEIDPEGIKIKTTVYSCGFNKFHGFQPAKEYVSAIIYRTGYEEFANSYIKCSQDLHERARTENEEIDQRALNEYGNNPDLCKKIIMKEANLAALVRIIDTCQTNAYYFHYDQKSSGLFLEKAKKTFETHRAELRLLKQQYAEDIAVEQGSAKRHLSDKNNLK